MGRTATVIEVASSSAPGTTYRVWVGGDGPIFCDCPGHKFKRPDASGQRKPCKHMTALGASPDVVRTAQLAAKTGEWGSSVLPSSDRRFRFIEVQEETDEGAWVAVSDLRRFNNLEVD